ncbi:hypothetical protein C1645_828952 [Glomus cerebriforme]|uniref:OTU domain-containing protein n=1 Tax=Glomus cerebriforme TaxID=658196 RepID=A0A397SRU7_9GLOM|nr:hypothetical protein C1645_828952 [Glomus cerebriforme]
MEFMYGRYAKSKCVDDHEREDIVTYHKEFLETMAGERLHILVTHNEITFQSNDGLKSGWRPKNEQSLRKKRMVIVFAFDNSSSYAKLADNTLNAANMKLNPGGKQPIMHNISFNGQIQSIVFPDDYPDEKLCENPKEASLENPKCCARHVLAAQKDFLNQKLILQEVIEELEQNILLNINNFINEKWNNDNQNYEAMKLLPERYKDYVCIRSIPDGNCFFNSTSLIDVIYRNEAFDNENRIISEHASVLYRPIESLFPDTNSNYMNQIYNRIILPRESKDYLSITDKPIVNYNITESIVKDQNYSIIKVEEEYKQSVIENYFNGNKKDQDQEYKQLVINDYFNGDKRNQNALLGLLMDKLFLSFVNNQEVNYYWRPWQISNYYLIELLKGQSKFLPQIAVSIQKTYESDKILLKYCYCVGCNKSEKITFKIIIDKLDLISSRELVTINIIFSINKKQCKYLNGKTYGQCYGLARQNLINSDYRSFRDMRKKILSTIKGEIKYTGTNTLAQLLKERTLQLDSWRNKFFGSAPEGKWVTNSSVQNELFSLAPEGTNSSARLLKVNWVNGRNELFGSTSEGTNSSARPLKINWVNGGNELFGSAPKGMNSSAQLLKVNGYKKSGESGESDGSTNVYKRILNVFFTIPSLGKGSDASPVNVFELITNDLSSNNLQHYLNIYRQKELQLFNINSVPYLINTDCALRVKENIQDVEYEIDKWECNDNLYDLSELNFESNQNPKDENLDLIYISNLLQCNELNAWIYTTADGDFLLKILQNYYNKYKLLISQLDIKIDVQLDITGKSIINPFYNINLKNDLEKSTVKVENNIVKNLDIGKKESAYQ